MPIEIRSAPIRLDAESKVLSTSADDRTVEFLACRETPIQRFDWFKGEPYLLTFAHTSKAIDLSRLTAGQVMHLSEHTGLFSAPKRLGKVTGAEIKDGALYTTHKINNTQAATEYWEGEILSGTEPGLSIEADVTKLEVLEKAQYEEDPETGRRKLLKPAHLMAAEWQLLAIANADTPAILGTGRRKKKMSVEQQEELERLSHVVQLSGETGYEFLFDDDADADVNLEAEDNPMVDEKTKATATDMTTSERLTQMSDEIRDLKLRLSASEKAGTEAQAEVARLNTINQYWQLRSNAVGLYALENKLTEEEYNLDFSEDPGVDIERLTSMGADDARIELKTIDRALRRAAMKQPIDRVTNPADRAKLENSSLKSRAADVDPGKREVAGDVQLQSSPTGESAKTYAQSIVDKLFK